MKRLIGMGALLMALSACGIQTPAISPGNPPFQAIAPAGYCLSDESDRLTPEIFRTIGQAAEERWQVLAAFRPCAEPVQGSSPARSWHNVRLIFRARLMTSPGDRQVFLAFMANPKITELLNQRVVPRLRDQIPEAFRKSVTISDLRYLGSDADAVYDGFEITTRKSAPAPIETRRAVSGQTVIGRYTLSVTAVSLVGGALPEDWEALQKTIAEAIHGTIAIADHPTRAPQPSPPPPSVKPGASGLSA